MMILNHLWLDATVCSLLYYATQLQVVWIFLQIVETILDHSPLLKVPVLLIGDSNIGLCLEILHKYNLLDVTRSYGCLSVIQPPPRLHIETSALLDLCITNHP